MADTTTPNYGLTKPEVGASDDTWGEKTNNNWDIVDAAIAAAAAGGGGGGTDNLKVANNLNDVADKPTSRTNLAVPYVGGGTVTGVWQFSGSIQLGPNAGISGAPIVSRHANGNDFEFGHPSPDTTKYLGILGHEVTTGAVFVGLGAEAGTTPGTYRTRGLKGRVLRNAGGYIQSLRVPTPNADDQAPVLDFQIDDNGIASFVSPPLAPTPAAGSNNLQLATTEFVRSITDQITTRVLTYEQSPFNAVGNGSADDTAALNACLAAAASAAPCVVLGRPGAIYSVNANVIFSGSDVTFDFRGATIKMVGSTNFIGFMLNGGATTATDVTVNAFIGDHEITLASAAGMAVGDFVHIRENAGIYAWILIAQIIAVSGNKITIDLALPFDIVASNTQSVYKMSPRFRCRVINLVIDMRSSTATALTAALYFDHCVDCEASNIYIMGNGNGRAVTTDVGRNNTYRDIYVSDGGGGSGNEQDIQFQAETLAHYDNVFSDRSKGFGPTIALNCYSYIADFKVVYPWFRGFKLQQSLECHVNGVLLSGAGTTGFGVVVGSRRNKISNITSISGAQRSGPFPATLTITSPGVVTITGTHILQNLKTVYFATTGALPTPLVAGTSYTVRNLSGNTFNLSPSEADATLINFTGTQSGTHTLFERGYQYGIWVHESSDNLFSNISSEDNIEYDIFEQQNSTGNRYQNVKVSDQQKVNLTSGGVIEGLTGPNDTVTIAASAGVEGSATITKVGHNAVGGYISAVVAVAEAVALTNSVAKTIVTLNLPPGEWDLIGVFCTNPAGMTSSNALLAGINTVTNVAPGGGDPSYTRFAVSFTANAAQYIPLGRKRVVISVATNFYLVGQVNFSPVDTMKAFGSITARRIR